MAVGAANSRLGPVLEGYHFRAGRRSTRHNGYNDEGVAAAQKGWNDL